MDVISPPSRFEWHQLRMKATVYAELRQALLQDDKKALEAAKEKYPWVEFDTVVAIKSQESSRQIRMHHHKFRTRQRIQGFIARYVMHNDRAIQVIYHLIVFMYTFDGLLFLRMGLGFANSLQSWI